MDHQIKTILVHLISRIILLHSDNFYFKTILFYLWLFPIILDVILISVIVGVISIQRLIQRFLDYQLLLLQDIRFRFIQI